MNRGPLARFFGLDVRTRAPSGQSAPTAFKSSSISMQTFVARMASTASALDLPFDEAIRFFRDKASVPTKSWRDVWDAAHSKMFMVAGANSEALVGDFKEAITKALEQGTTLDEFRKDFDQIVKKHGWSYKGERGWRTRTIYETNLRTAYAAGRYAKLTAPDTLAVFPYWQYNHSGAVHPRVQHKAWDGEVYPAGDAFWTVAYPPNGFGCGCFVTPVSRSGLKRLGKAAPDTSPNLDQLGTDQPLGVDPSFAYNPGQAWMAQTAPGPTAVTASEANVAAFVRSSLKGKWPDGSWSPVGIASKNVGKKLGVDAGTEIRLTAETIRADIKDMPLKADAYGVVPRWLAQHGKLIQDPAGRWTLVGKYQGKSYRAVLDLRSPSNQGKRQIYLSTLEQL